MGPITNPSIQGTTAILYSILYLQSITETPRISVYEKKGVDKPSKNPSSSLMKKSKLDLWLTNPIQQNTFL